MKKKQLHIIVGLAGALVISAVVMLVWPHAQPDAEVGGATASASPSFSYFSRLDGEGVLTKEEEIPSVVAIMIDNHPDAWPQSGIVDARVVYEAPAEGGITRYLAIFDKNQNVDEVGPVRSARAYYLDWTREYGNPPYMHVGGSPEALRLLKVYKMWDADQFFWPYYWRSRAKLAPHNVYTSAELWNKLFADYGARHPAQEWDGWTFAPPAALASVNASSSLKEITIKYGSGYVVSWQFSTTTNRYARFINGRPHKDSQGVQVMADNLLIQTAAVQILDDEGRKEIGTVGNGEARIITGGQLKHGTWKKETATSRTRFYSEDGKEAVLTPGQTWVQVVPVGATIEVTN